MSQIFGDFTDEQKSKILAVFKRTPETLKDDINAIKRWLETQPHLPEVPCDAMIEGFLKLCKFSIEKTKKRIDGFYTIRSKLPEIFHMTNIHPSNPLLRECADSHYTVHLPKVTDDLSRITIFKFTVRDPNAFHPVLSSLWSLHVHTVRLLEDFTVSTIFIFDLENITFSHLSKFTPGVLKLLSEVDKNTFKRSVKSAHFINCPSIADSLFRIARAVASPKVIARIVVHKTLDTLYEKVPKELLPSDYGGHEESLKTLHDKMKSKMTEYKNYFDHLDTLKVNEDLRPEKLVDDEFLGAYGNFRKLDLD